MVVGSNRRWSILALLIDTALRRVGAEIAPEPGLSAVEARRRIQSFVDLVAADGLRFREARIQLARAGFSQAEGSAEELRHADGESVATIVVSERRPSLCLRFSPSGWAELAERFEAKFERALGAPLQRRADGAAGERIYTARVAGRMLRLEFACASHDGVRWVYLFAALAETGAAAPRAEPRPRASRRAARAA